MSGNSLRLLATCDQGGRADGVQFMLHRGYGYVGHMFSDGVTVLDLRDPKNPQTVGFIAAPKNTRASHLQAADDLLLVINGVNLWTQAALSNEANYFNQPLTETVGKRHELSFAAGLRVYDISRPAAPREIAFLPVDGLGVHRIWYVGGRYAYCSAHFEGWSDHILAVIDLADPAKPRFAGRSWLPGMWRAGGEPPHGPGRYALHHALVTGSYAYAAWRDGGLTVHDIGDPEQPRLLAHRNWSPPFGGGTHSPLPLPERDLLVVADEATKEDCAAGMIWVFDIRARANPVGIATMPRPAEENFAAKGAKFGPHNLHENRPGGFQSADLIFATYYNAGLRVYDIADPYRPQEVAHYVPPPPRQMIDPRPGRPRVIQSCDVHVDARGIVYMTDSNAGLTILEYEGAR